MKNRFILICAVFCSVQAMAALSLVVKPLSGKECITALGNIGKIAYSGDSIYMYDAAKYLVFSDSLANVQHVRFSDEQPTTPTEIENTSTNGSLQVNVYPNPTQDVLHVKNAKVDMVRLYTATGQLVQVEQVQTSEVQLDVSSLPAGSYLLLCGNEVFQVIKQ